MSKLSIDIKKMFKVSFSFLLMLYTSVSYPQIGGQQTYQFLNLTPSARTAALGGKVISINDDDINLAVSNPALLNSEMSKNAAISYINSFIDINYGYANYAHHIPSYGTVMGGIQFVNYGTFINATETGEKLGEFRASEFAFNISGGRMVLDSIVAVGINAKFISSSFEQYKSSGIALDLAGVYISKNKNFSASLVLNNIGTQLKTYTPNNKEPMPFEVLLGISKRVAHAPLRISITAQHLEKWDLTYDVSGTTIEPPTTQLGKMLNLKNASNKLMRHVILGVELLPSPNFNIRLGYNFQRRKELMLSTRTATAGLSWGLGVKIKKFHISYGHAIYHLAGASNHFTLSTNLSSFYTKGR